MLGDRKLPLLIGGGALILLLLLVAANQANDDTELRSAVAQSGDGDGSAQQPTSTQAATTTTAEPTTSTASTLPPFTGWVQPLSSGLPWSELGAVEGLLTFRGNPTRSWYGRGPVPQDPKVIWTFNIGCSNSTVGGEPKQWCGSGWTGQPAIFHPFFLF